MSSLIKIYTVCHSVLDFFAFLDILSLPLIHEGQLAVSGERMCTILVNRLEDKACPVKMWLGKLTALDRTPLGWLGHKTSTQTKPPLSRDSPASLAHLDACQTGDQDVVGSILAGLDMKYFLWLFFPFSWFKKGNYHFLAKECAKVLVNHLED